MAEEEDSEESVDPFEGMGERAKEEIDKFAEKQKEKAEEEKEEE